MALQTGLPIPGHYSVNYVTSTTYTVPTFLGVYRANPPADAIWSLSPLALAVAGATLYICNNSAFNLTVNAAPGDFIGTGTSLAIAAGITQLFLTAGGNLWQTIIPMTILPPPPSPVNIVQPCRVGTTVDFSVDPGYSGVVYLGPGTFTLTYIGVTPLIDGVAMQIGDRVLVKDQTALVQNGIFAVTATVPKLVLVRTADSLFCNIIIGLNSGTVGQQSSYSLVTLNPVIGGSSSIVWIKNNVLTTEDGTTGGWGNVPALPSGGSTVYGSLANVAGAGQVYFGQGVGNAANGDSNILIGNGLDFPVGAINVLVGTDLDTPSVGESTIVGISNTVTSGGTGLAVYGQTNMITQIGATNINVFGTSNNIGSTCGIFGFGNSVASSAGSMIIGNVNSVTGSGGALLFGVGHTVGTSVGAVIIGAGVTATGATGSLVVSGSPMTLSGNTSATVFGNSNVLAANKTLVTVFGTGNTIGAANGLAVGISNTVGGIGSLTVGDTNVSAGSDVIMLGDNNTESGSNNLMITGSGNTVGTSANSTIKGFNNTLSGSANAIIMGSSLNLTNMPSAIAVCQSGMTISNTTLMTLVGNGCTVGNSIANITVFGYGNTARANFNTIFGANNSASSVAFIFGVGNTVDATGTGATITGLSNVVTGSGGVVINGVSNHLTGCNGAVVLGRSVTLTNITRGLILTNAGATASGNTGLIMIGGGNTVPSNTNNNALVGGNNVSGGNENIMFGHDNSGTGDLNVIYGNNNVSASFNIIVGNNNTATGTNVVNVGIGNNITSSDGSVIYGDNNTVTTSPTALVIGMNITANGSSNIIALATAGTSLSGNTETVLIGNSSSIAGGASMVTLVGFGNSAANSDVAVFGTNNSATGANTNVFGVGNTISSNDVSAYGINHTVSTSVGACVFGVGNTVVGSAGAIVGGGGLSVTGCTNALVVSATAVTANANNNLVLLGDGNTITTGVSGLTVVGSSNSAALGNTVLLGTGNVAGGSGAVIVGVGSTASGTNGLVFGSGLTNSVANSVAIGAGGVMWIGANVAGIASSTGGQSGFYANQPANTKNPAGATYSMTIVDVAPDSLVVAQSVTAGNETWTLPTAAALFAVFALNAVGTSFTFSIRNQSVSAWIILATNTGIGFGLQASNLVPCATTVTLKVTLTALTPTYVVQQVNAAPSVENIGNNLLYGPSTTISGGVSEAVVIGDGASSNSNSAVVIGQLASAVGAANSIVMGHSATGSAANVVVMGQGMTNSTANSLLVGASGTSWLVANSAGVGTNQASQAGFYANQPANTKNPAGASYAMTIVDVAPDSLVVAQSVTAGNETWTLPTAAALAAVFTPSAVGTSFIFAIRNQSVTAWIILAANTGIGFGLQVGNLIPCATTVTLKVTMTALTPTYVVQQINAAPSVENTGNNLLIGPSISLAGGVTEAIVIGDTATSTASSAIVMGQNSAVNASGSTAIGNNVTGNAVNTVVFGDNMMNSITNSLLVGAGGISWIVANAAGVGSSGSGQSGFYENMPANTKNPAGASYTLTTTDVAPGSLIVAQSVTGGGETWTVPTAAALLAVFAPTVTGTSYKFAIMNQSVTAQITLVANTGSTFGIGTTNLVTCASTAVYKVTCTSSSIPTYVFQQLSVAPNTQNTGANLIYGPSATVASGVTESIVVGDGASAAANNAVVIGQGASVTGVGSTSAIVMGKNGVGSATNVISLGNGMTNSLANSLLAGAGGTSWLVANAAGVGTNQATQAGFYYNMPANTKNPAGATYTMTTTDVAPDALIVAQSVTALGETWTLPTAAALAAVFTPTAVGTSFTFKIRNQSVTASITLAANTGVTFGLQAANLVPCATTVELKVTQTALTPTYVVQQVNAAPSVENTGNNLLYGPSTTVTGGATETIVIGDGATASASSALAVGRSAVVSATNAIALGNSTNNSIANSVLVGASGTSWLVANSGGVSSSLSGQSGFYSNQPANTKNPAGTPYQMTTVDVSPGSLIVAQSVTGGGETWTLPTASNIFAAFTPTATGSSFQFTIRNQSATANITLVVNTGCTFGLEASDVVTANNVATYKVTCTSPITPSYVFQLVSLISGSPTIENFNVSTPNTVVNPTVAINITTLQISAATGTTTGTLANGQSNGFMKTISVDQAVTPYVLTITNYLNQYGGQNGVIGSYAITFSQPGTNYTFMWDATAGTWVNRSFSQPPYISRYVIVISIDPEVTTVVRAIGSDNVVVATGTNVNGGGTTTATVLNLAGAYLATNYGGGDIFIKGGTYFLIGNTWIISQANITVRGESTSLIYSSVVTGFTVETTAVDTSFFNLRFGFLAGFSPTVVNGTITYGNQYGIMTSTGAARLTVRDCRFIGLLIGVYVQANVSDTLVNINLFETCYQGILYQSTAAGFSVRHVATNNNMVGLQNYGVLVSNGCKAVVVANNTMDLVQSITTANNLIGYGVGVTGDGTNNAITGVVADVSIIGNQIQNSYCAGVWIQTGVTNVTITANTLDTCAATVVTPLGGNIGNLAAINVPVTGTSNVTVCDNTISNCYNPILLYCNGGYASGNILLNNAGINYYIRGNAITNIDKTAHPLYQIIEERTDVTAITLSTAGTVVGQSTGAGTPGVFVAALAYQSTLSQSAAMNSTFNSFFNFGAVLSAITFVVGFTGSTLPGCTATISVSNAAGAKLTLLSSTTFTAPQTVSILTDAATTITLPTPITVPPGILRIDLTTPSGQLFNTKYCPVVTQVGVSNVIATSADNYSFTFVVTPYLSSKIFSIGDQGGGIGQFIMGANGSAFTQIRTYTFSGTLPAVAKNTFATIGPLAAAGAATTDMLTIATLIALPTNNIFYTNAFVNATNQITFTVANYSATNYAGGGAYTVKIMGLT